jgi:hypothetical protein
MQPIEPAKFYEQQIQEKSIELAGLKKRHSTLGWIRFSVMALLITSIYGLWPMGLGVVIPVGVVLLAAFLYLVSVALDTESKIQHTERFIDICREELLVLLGKYTHRNDGANWLGYFKLTDNDLDVFGQASLFQYINRSGSFHGQLALANSCTTKTTKEIIVDKQLAVKELQNLSNWRLQLQTYAGKEPISKNAETVVNDWLAGESGSLTKPGWRIMRWIVPIISFGAVVLYMADIIPEGLLNTILILMLAFVSSLYKKVSQQYSHLSKIVPQLNAFMPLLKWIESGKFQSALLQEQQQHLRHEGKNASNEIAALNAILKRFDYRLNPVVHLPLNVFLFWDLQQVLALEKWKQKQTAQIGKWFEAAGKIEMLASLGTLSFNNPNWVFPEITDDWFDLQCSQAGHPLIKESKLVSNSFNMSGTPSFALITGSNMAGKSTFLRTIGANMLLAMAGSPVRANFMKLPVLRVICSMRIMDNLEEETSTFYAELKKMKAIVEAANAGEKVFILIDEMLRGTNTFDRHTGSVALIKQLLHKNAVGIVATHDVALADLELQFPGKVTNYHFDSTIENEEIIFDYKIKNGVCQSTNASLLMKKIGIEI